MNLFVNSVVITALLMPGNSLAVGSQASPQDTGKSSIITASMHLNPLKAKTATRFIEDQPDKHNGLQIRAIYVVPMGATDRNLDTNGTIEKYLKEGNRFLKNTIGETFQLDTRLDGTLDIGFWSPDENTKNWPSTDSWVANHGEIFDPKVSNRKHYVFFLEGKAPGLCGTNDMRNGSVIYLRSSCKGQVGQVKYFQSIVWVHEVFHNFGAAHNSPSPGFCELMASPCAGRPARVQVKLNLKGYKSLNSVFTSGGVWSGKNAAVALKPAATCTNVVRDVLETRNNYYVCPVGLREINTNSFSTGDLSYWSSFVMEDESGATPIQASLSTQKERFPTGLSSDYKRVLISWQRNEVGVTTLRNPQGLETYTIFWRN
jgi:hypothetical protein